MGVILSGSGWGRLTLGDSVGQEGDHVVEGIFFPLKE